MDRSTKNSITIVNPVLNMLVNLSLAIQYGPRFAREQITWCSWKVYQPIYVQRISKFSFLKLNKIYGLMLNHLNHRFQKYRSSTLWIKCTRAILSYKLCIIKITCRYYIKDILMMKIATFAVRPEHGIYSAFIHAGHMIFP